MFSSVDPSEFEESGLTELAERQVDDIDEAKQADSNANTYVPDVVRAGADALDETRAISRKLRSSR